MSDLGRVLKKIRLDLQMAVVCRDVEAGPKDGGSNVSSSDPTCTWWYVEMLRPASDLATQV